ncbi:hypothetical protein FACS1894137_08550 [Spirochaetia bacterium]|nr:hypothetical protein FACS1894137_08550 [Spirochaetia bacterium]
MADTDQTFSAIIRGMQHAVNTAQETLQNFQFQQMLKYFNPDTGEPYTVYVTLSDGRRIDIPQITLVPQSLLSIDELEMSFAVQVAHTEVKGGGTENEKPKAGAGKPLPEPDRASFQVQFARRTVDGDTGEAGAGDGDGGTVSVRIKFKSIPVPEGAARVLDSLNLDIGEKAGTQKERVE